MNNQSDAKYLYDRAKSRAKKKGREFTITVKDIEEVDTDWCQILNIPIKRYRLTPGSGKSGIQKPDCKSLDRIDSCKGYVPGNIRIISWRANRLLNDITLDELRLIAAYYHSLKTNDCQVQNKPRKEDL